MHLNLIPGSHGASYGFQNTGIYTDLSLNSVAKKAEEVERSSELAYVQLLDNKKQPLKFGTWVDPSDEAVYNADEDGVVSFYDDAKIILVSGRCAEREKTISRNLDLCIASMECMMIYFAWTPAEYMKTYTGLKADTVRTFTCRGRKCSLPANQGRTKFNFENIVSGTQESRDSAQMCVRWLIGQCLCPKKTQTAMTESIKGRAKNESLVSGSLLQQSIQAGTPAEQLLGTGTGTGTLTGELFM